MSWNSRHPVTAVTRAYDPTADQKIVGSGNEDGRAPEQNVWIFPARHAQCDIWVFPHNLTSPLPFPSLMLKVSYLKWFREVFLKYIPMERPVLLLVDGHKAHVTQDVIEVAVENQILVFCLPAHASHLLQPLDLSLFGPLNKGWVKACAAFHHLTFVVVNQRNFAKIFNVAWHSSNTPDVIRAGFRRSGIYPFDPNKFDYGKLAPSQPSTTATSIGTPSAPPVAAPFSTGTPTVTTADCTLANLNVNDICSTCECSAKYPDINASRSQPSSSFLVPSPLHQHSLHHMRAIPCCVTTFLLHYPPHHCLASPHPCTRMNLQN